MKDERIKLFRTALEGLLESLDATVRVNRWTGAESIPEPLMESASRLMERLGTADRLAASTFNGSPNDNARVKVICASLRRLDAAYVAYRQRFEAEPSARELAATTLNAELDEVRSAAAAAQSA